MKGRLSKPFKKLLVYLLCAAMVFAYILPVLAESEKEAKPDATQIEETQPEDKGQTPSDSKEPQREAPVDAKDTSDAKDETPADAKDASDVKDKAVTNANSIVNFRGDGGSGSRSNPWQIGTLARLEALAKAVNSGNNMSGKYFILTADIGDDANGLTTPIGDEKHRFNGHFNGAGHTVVLNMNMNIDFFVGLFGHIGDRGSVANVNTAGKVEAGVFVGGVCGYSDHGSITNCRNSATVTGERDVGGVCGRSFGSISNCCNNGSLISKAGTDNNFFGGVCGCSYGSISNCFNSGSMEWDTLSRCMGGVCGSISRRRESKIINCYYDKTVCRAEKAVGDEYNKQGYYPEQIDHVEGLPTTQMKAAAGEAPKEDWVAIAGSKKNLVDLLNDYGKGHDDWNEWSVDSDYPQYKITDGLPLNAYLEGLNPQKTKITVNDNYNYANRINGKTNNVTEQDVRDNIVLTGVTERAYDDYYNSTKTTQVLCALGTGYNDAAFKTIYPGAILKDVDKVAKGITPAATIGNLSRGSGSFKFKYAFNDGFDIEDMSPDNVADTIQKKVYALSESGAKEGFEFRVMAASSPEQLSRGLNLTTDVVSEAVSADQWEKIRSGEKNVVVVYAQQIVDAVEFSVENNDYAGLFAPGTTSDYIKRRLDPDNAMLVKKVNYGIAYLLTLDLNMTGSPGEYPIDLAEAVKKFFQGRSGWTSAQKNALKYAKVSVKQIGNGCPKWTVNNAIKTVPDFITYLSNHPYDKLAGKPEEGVYKLVPLSYEACAVGGRATQYITIENTAKQYEFSMKKATKIRDLGFGMRALGDRGPYYFKTYGIDLDAFNNNGSIQEKEYAVFDSASKDHWIGEVFERKDGTSTKKFDEQVFRWINDVPAYQNIYGLDFALDKGTNGNRGEAVIKTAYGKRIYNNAGLKLISYGEKNVYNQELTGTVRRSNLSGSDFRTDFIYHRGAYKNQNKVNIQLKDCEYPSKWEEAAVKKILTVAARSRSGPGYEGPEVILSYDDRYEKDGENLYTVNRTVEGEPMKAPVESEKAVIKDAAVNPIKEEK